MPPSRKQSINLMQVEDDSDFLRAVANMYGNRPLKRVLAPEEYHRVLAVLGRHHAYKTVVKSHSVAGVTVVKNQIGGLGRVFKVITTRGTHVILSQSEIFSGPADPYTALESSGRAAIHGQIKAFAKDWWAREEQKPGYNEAEGTPCPVNGSIMYKKKRSTWDVDHWGAFSNFSVLLARWVRENRINVPGIRFNHNHSRFAAASLHVQQHWEEWHRRHATLKVISANANRSKGGQSGFSLQKAQWKRDHPYTYQNVQLTHT